MNNMRGGAFDCEEQYADGSGGLLHLVDQLGLEHRREHYFPVPFLPNGIRLVLEEDR